MHKILLSLILCSILLQIHGQEVRIGAGAGEGMLVQPRQAEVGPDGNIYVFDSADSYFKVFLPDGRFLKRFGGKGQGPGEIARADGLRFFFSRDGKTVVWTEYFRGHPWITLMGLDGRLQKVIKVDVLTKGLYGLAGGVDLGDGTWLLELQKAGEVRRSSQYFIYGGRNSLIAVDSAGQAKAEWLQVSYDSRISIISDGGDLGIPFVPNFTWAKTQAQQIIFGDGREGFLQVLDLKGKGVGRIPLPLAKPKPVTAAMIGEWRETLRRKFSETTSSRGWFERFGKVVDSYKESLYPVVPSFGSFWMTPEGNILLSAYNWKDDESHEYWLVSPRGKELGHWKKAVRLAHLSRSQILYYRSDEDGGTTLCARPRRGSEAEDLGNLK